MEYEQMTDEEQKKAKQREAFKKWYAKNKERKMAANRQYKKEHKGQQAEYQAAYYKAHKEELKPRHRQWYWNHRAEFLAYVKSRYVPRTRPTKYHKKEHKNETANNE